MIKLPIVVFHSGQWDDTNSYLNYKTTGVLVDEMMCFKNLEDKDVTWFLSLVKGQITRHPLVAHAIAHVSNMDLEWSSVVDSEMDNLCSLLPSSSIDDDFQILTDIHVSSLSSTFDLKEKDMFASKELLSKSFYYIAIKNNFEFKTVRSNSKSIEFKCSQHNFPWYVRASHYKGGELWRLRKYIANHNCSINVIQTTHKQAYSSLISDCIVKDFSSLDRSTPNDIIIHMRTKLGVNVSYYKAWRAKGLVMNSLNGEAKESYALIPNFFMKLKEINPGSFTAYETDTEGHFKYCFMAIGACIEGWKYCRPNISVDDTFLKSKYGGTLLTASTIDDYLSKVSFEKWARAYCTRKIYQMMTTNILENLNVILKEFRDLHVAALLDSIRQILQNWFYDWRKVACCMRIVLTSWAEGELRIQHQNSRSFTVNAINDVEFQVIDGRKQFIVRLDYKSCTYHVWDLDEIPCAHALAVLHGLRPVGNHANWKSIGIENNILPPTFKRRAG
ncbi:uncharacterized protein E5676_scaffold552G00250 [Cucumis melo var. makuwa]|uniref:SWIM-type domain-containing protein n=1 Tax=Cucumis melo var. makuwa TaxID=1194695 RepID=A0A5D3CRP1_CUCMM|nr:uncharacterized protein E5676_scaffold552G00250 [Cucumis melo var. makuwa]